MSALATVGSGQKTHHDAAIRRPNVIASADSGRYRARVIKALHMVLLLVAFALGSGGGALLPSMAQAGAGPMTAGEQMSPGQVADAAMASGDMTIMGDCEACGPSQRSTSPCDFVCPPGQFTPPLAVNVAFALSVTIPPLPLSQRMNGLTPTPSPPPPRLTILV